MHASSLSTLDMHYQRLGAAGCTSQSPWVILLGSSLLQTVRRALESLLRTHGIVIGSITVTGHSLGGALATVCAVWAPEQYPLAPVSLYTFGQPRVGNDEFVSHLNSVVSGCFAL